MRVRELLVPPGDADVGTYYAVAHAWLEGALPYTAVWEYKPPGLFALCAAGLAAFHDASLSATLLGLGAVVATAFSAYWMMLGSEGARSRTSALLAAAGVVLLSSENAGTYGDAELFVNAAIAAGVALALARRGTWAIFGVGCAAAVALQMKLTAIPLVAALALIVAMRAESARALRGAAVVCLALVPFGLEAVLFARAGSFGPFIDANIGATLRRFAGPYGAARSPGGMWAAQLVLLAPYVEFVPFAFGRARAARYAALWLCAAIAAVVVAREYYPRHFVLLVPPVAVLGALGFEAFTRRIRARRRTLAGAVFVLAALGLHGYYPIAQGVRVAYHRYVLRDAGWHTSAYLTLRDAVRRRLGADRSLYVLQLSPQLYGDLDVPAPTRYVFSGNLFERPMWPMLGFAGGSELARVLDGRPRYLVTGSLRGTALDPPVAAFVRARIARDYRLLERAGGASIYALRSRGMGGGAAARTQTR